MVSKSGLLFMLVSAGAVLPGAALAYKLSPSGTEEERRLAEIRGGWISRLERFAASKGLEHFTDPVHEEITNRMFGCDGGYSQCGGAVTIRAPGAVMAGVRWNDDPAFRIDPEAGRGTRCKVLQTIRFQTQPYCWYQLFDDARGRAASGEHFDEQSGAALLYRSHFGDLQALHAMAAREGEPAAETQAQVLAWSEFTWRVALGEHGLETPVREVMPQALSRSFQHSGWTVQDLFTTGTPGLRRHIREMALGSFLHTLQDSFAAGHAERGNVVASQRCELGRIRVTAPGPVVEFYSYARQDEGRHGESDGRAAFIEAIQEPGDVVDLGRPLVDAFYAEAPWEEVRPYVECIYRLAPDARDSSPGAAYVRLAP